MKSFGRNIGLILVVLCFCKVAYSQNATLAPEGPKCDIEISGVDSVSSEPVKLKRVDLIKAGSARTVRSELRTDLATAKVSDGGHFVTVAADGYRTTDVHFSGLCSGNHKKLVVPLIEGDEPKIDHLSFDTEKKSFKEEKDESKWRPRISIGKEVPTRKGLADSTGDPLSKGVVNGSAINLEQPVWPNAARALNACGDVFVRIIISIEGKVLSATMISGHPVFRKSVTEAALKSRFKKTTLDGQPVEVSGVVVYRFGCPKKEKRD